ncbi:SRPBCC family protein [Nocardioides sp. NPDC051685]|uniref:SRPBCC family protein n=1 Tax=Nocardioides sp. NPDC051685 TaxID=3364334 RepID=UPI0037892E44
MKLEHSFHVDEDIDTAWDVLNDVRRVALCMPGAAVDTVDGDDITGTCKVKLGPIGLTYKGQATFIERDALAHRMVLHGKGQDGANGRAALAVVVNLTPEGGKTRVDLETDLKLTGKPAQFGRGVMADVGDRLIGQFADALARQLAEDKVSPPSPAPSTAVSGEIDHGSAEPLDLLSVASRAMARRSATTGLSLVGVLLLTIAIRRARRR